MFTTRFMLTTLANGVKNSIVVVIYSTSRKSWWTSHIEVTA